MRLSEIIKDLKMTSVTGSTDIEITDGDIDSRQVAPGHLFVAIRGTQTDGHQYIGKALEQGAAAILCEHTAWQDTVASSSQATIIVTESTEAVVGAVATAFQGNPTAEMKLVGVTGTNGKTTIATLLYNMFRQLGHKCGLLSTVCNYVDGEPVPATHTTPDPVELNRLLRRMMQDVNTHSWSVAVMPLPSTA